MDNEKDECTTNYLERVNRVIKLRKAYQQLETAILSLQDLGHDVAVTCLNHELEQIQKDIVKIQLTF